MPARGYEFYLRKFNSISRTREISGWTREITFVSTNGHVIFSLLYKQQYYGDFSNFPKISEDFRRFSKIIRTLSEAHTNISDHLPKIAGDI